VLVTLSRVNNTEVTVDFQAADDSATADSDYEEKSGTLFPLDGGTRGGSRNGPVLAFVMLIKHGVPLYKTIVFGSRARGEAEPDSDLDVLVVSACTAESPRDLLAHHSVP
jgi:hypothetical protein